MYDGLAQRKGRKALIAVNIMGTSILCISFTLLSSLTVFLGPSSSSVEFLGRLVAALRLHHLRDSIDSLQIALLVFLIADAKDLFGVMLLSCAVVCCFWFVDVNMTSDSVVVPVVCSLFPGVAPLSTQEYLLSFWDIHCTM